MLLVAAACTVEEDFTGTPGGNQDLYYTPEGGADEDISLGLFDVIDLDYPGLEQVKESYEAGDYYYAAYYLLDYYRNRSNVSNPGVDASIMNPSASDSDRNMADQALKANGSRFYVRNDGGCSRRQGPTALPVMKTISIPGKPSIRTGSIHILALRRSRHQTCLGTGFSLQKGR